MTKTSGTDTTVNVSVITGLPELPEGYYWHVGRYYGSSGVAVSIMKRLEPLTEKQIRRNASKFKRRWFGVSYDYVTVEYMGNFESDIPSRMSREQWILNTAIQVLERFNRSTYIRDWSDYMGDYPPKKLEK